MKTCHTAGHEKHKNANRVKTHRCPPVLQLYSQSHGAQVGPGDIYGDSLHTEADDAATELIHDHQNSACVRYLSGCWQRCPIPQLLGIVPGGCILGVALKNVLKLFEGIIKLFLFV